MTTTPPAPQDDLPDRLLAALLGAYEVAAVALGDRLGWYRSLADGGPATAAELAARTDSDARYAREWLEHQAVSGYLDVADVHADPESRRYPLPDAHRAVLVDELDPGHMTPLARFTSAVVRGVPALTQVYRGRRTLSWADLGDEVRDAQAAANRPLFLGPLVDELLPAVPGLDAALSAGGRVADIGCGHGWSAIGIARRWPQARVDGFDVDPPSVARAHQHAEAAGVADRVSFRTDDVAVLVDDPEGPGQLDGAFDLVAAFECVHDLPQPVPVLRAMRRMVRPGGTVLVMDEAVAEEFTVPGSEVERLMYGYSLFCCLPDGRAHEPSVATGTVMRPGTLRTYARAAGFADVEVLPLDNDFFRFYRLVG
ncbi:class I SAM-dependent methyltransferase [Modestobacter marinus]|uniref:SAM-dependent methyltransferase n=1 Tax=Modestobacter marinus TaxID=477641 RepID=A0A846LWF2_9ACTN|nr:class I SAM-dependent methyltransferase [Modestobacter marinus]NIH66700.1 SAM-dependent methyltransferase [Modestobacter marinus]GGL48390.1 SAM-dependent methyltransferase [Modestobacter marinus]